MRILLVEDDAELASWLARSLRQGSFLADHAPDAASAEALLAEDDAYDAIVLDLGLPDRPGNALLASWRQRGVATPVLVLTARGALPDKVQSLRGGADDFLAKPFEVAELEARLAALVRRSRRTFETRVSCGSLDYDLADRSFTLGGAPLQLTPRERSALAALVLKAGSPVPKQQLHRKVFPVDSEAGPEAIEQVLHRVRRKLEGSDVQVLTVRGLGYILQPAAVQA
ncbi:response regulator [Ramlibacter humi]|uniref:Response regulator n=1 Tax=Ramlibacter humi TaxID=2530451 RepID=A0A4Z0BJ73_9BURK|nr:response regulator [Ramlibacter humi]TFY98174.1 response regulator [Ramlibacter humi]